MELGDIADGADASSNSDSLERLALHPNCGAEDIVRFCSHGDERVRCAVARRPDLPETLVWTLASDPSPRVRYRLAANSEVVDFALEILLEDEHQAVSARAERTLRNRNASPAFGKVIEWFFPGRLKQAG